MRLFFPDRVESGRRGDFPSRSRDAEEAALEERREDDRAVRCPGASPYVIGTPRTGSEGCHRTGRSS